MPDATPLSPATLAVTAGRPPVEPGGPLNPPVVLASTFHAGGEVGYGRWGNPTWQALEDALAALEAAPGDETDGGKPAGATRALAFASGMAAVHAVLDLVPVGGLVVAPTHAYSGTLALLRQWEATGRLRSRLADVSDTPAVLTAANGADLVWLESPTNPALEVADIAAISAALRERGTLVACDNTFATPLGQRPLALGADIVVHSATKFLAGHSDVVLGAAVTGRADLAEALRQRRTSAGAIPGPMEAYLVLRGMRTLAIRMQRAQDNAVRLASRLADHPRVTRVRYPGFGAIVAIEVAGGAGPAERVCEATRLWVHATSLGGVESTLERRRRWAEESPDIPEGLVRLSVGIEDVEDLWRDLAAALDAAGTT